jgi:hypothetical protein
MHACTGGSGYTVAHHSHSVLMVTGAGALYLGLLACVDTFGNGAHEMAAYRKELVHSVRSG